MSGVPVVIVPVSEHLSQGVTLGITDVHMEGSPVIVIVGHDVVTEGEIRIVYVGRDGHGLPYPG